MVWNLIEIWALLVGFALVTTQIILAIAINLPRWDHSSSDATHWRLTLLSPTAYEARMISKQQRRYPINLRLISSNLGLLLNILLKFTHLIYLDILKLLMIFWLAKLKTTVLELFTFEGVDGRAGLRLGKLVNRKVLMIMNVVAALSLTRADHGF